MNEGDVITRRVAAELDLDPRSVAAARTLFADGATVPFVARYRKERTGGLDEVALRNIIRLGGEITKLEEHRAAIHRRLTEAGVLTDPLSAEIEAAQSVAELDDIYRPYRPRKETRADRARARGLQPLAEALLRHARREGDAQRNATFDSVVAAASPPAVPPGEALGGAAEIIGEVIASDVSLRATLRTIFERRGAVASVRRRSVRKKEPDAERYRDYFDHREPARSVPSHRLLAMLRGASLGYLSVTLRPPDAAGERSVAGTLYCTDGGEPRHLDAAGRRFFRGVVTDTWKRRLVPTLEREALAAVRRRAERDAIQVFQRNLEALLLAAPFGPRPVLAVDPGIRTGSKIAVLSAGGQVLKVTTIHPLTDASPRTRAAEQVEALFRHHEIEAVAVGDGTGGRETERFFRDYLETRNSDLPVVSVHEAGASVYSASEYAAYELPGLDIVFRGAVSIGRRFQDPLSELVKIDPASVGVGQYQHDVDQNDLAAALNATVESCVNRVGVDINTAGAPLLARVAGLNRRQAEAVVAYRERNGLFMSRSEIRNVAGVGARTIQQAVGFLRCPVADNPLENTAVHPERYDVVAKIAADLGITVGDLVGDESAIAMVEPSRYVDTDADLGMPTIIDILEEMKRPGRDPRETFVPPQFDDAVRSIDDLEEGQNLTGIVRNVTAFGAFVDIGVHRDGLVHVSELADRYVKDPGEVVTPGDTVRVVVCSVDHDRQRIELSMKRATG